MASPRIGNYRIDSELGEGGFGKVYRAYDEQLDRPVAIKVITASELADPTARERFRREARSAAGLTHPAIVQVHELGSEDDRDYIVMELVEGHTLADLLRDGPLEPLRAAALFREIAEGLAAAHAKNIVHRDIKAQNVMVTPDGHAKILDFGIAKRLASNERSLTVLGTAVGTLYTMSPEQVGSEGVDHRSDLFSLGVILYQALTGRAPFRANSVRELLAEICVHDPPPLTELDPNIPPALSRLIVGLLQKEPRDRPQTAAEVAAELAGVVAASDPPSSAVELGAVKTSVKASASAVPVSPSAGASGELSGPTVPLRQSPTQPHAARRQRQALAVLGVVLISVLAATAVWHLVFEETDIRPSPSRQVLRVPAGETPGLVLLGFDDAANDPQVTWMIRALEDLLAFELAETRSPRLVSAGEELSAIAFDPVGLDGEILDLVRRTAGANVVATGRITPASAPGEVEVELSLTVAATGQRVDLPALRDAEARLPELAAELARELARTLDFEPAAPAASDDPPPLEPEAAGLYAAGREALRRLDGAAAREHFAEALRLAPREPTVHAGLADALWSLGRELEARQHLGQAVANAARYDRPTRLALRARQLASERQWQRAAALATALELAATARDTSAAEDPSDQLDRGLRLARFQTIAGMHQHALTTLDALRGLPADVRRDPRLELLEAELAKRQPDYPRQLDAARRAARRAETLGRVLVSARARQLEGEALGRLGRQEEALVALAAAREIYAREHHHSGLAEAWYHTGVVLADQSDFWGEKRSYDRALALYESIGNRRMATRTKYNKAAVLQLLGQREASIETIRSLLEDFREIGDREAEAQVLLNFVGPLIETGRLGEARAAYEKAQALLDAMRGRKLEAWASTVRGKLLIAEGRLAEGQSALEKAAELRRATGDRQRGAVTSSYLAQALYHLGNLERAAELHERALTVFSEVDPVALARSRRLLGEVRLAQGDLTGARSQYELALAALSAFPVEEALARLSLAELLFHEQRFAEAERRARKAADDLARDELRLEESIARRLLARCLLARGAAREARREIERGRKLLGEEEVALFRLPVEIVTARVLAAEGEPEAARRALQSTLARATAAGFRALELEVLINLAELDLAAGEAGSGGIDITALEHDAGVQGFGLLARAAARLRQDADMGKEPEM